LHAKLSCGADMERRSTVEAKRFFFSVHEGKAESFGGKEEIFCWVCVLGCPMLRLASGYG
jgi:hypothetical protein